MAEPDEETDEPFRIPIEDALDLHPFRPNEIRDVTRDYLDEARRLGFTEVRLIHGRGKGVQRANVQRVLRELSYVTGVYDDAHLGATVVIMAPLSLK